jgi:hypothetical protein
MGINQDTLIKIRREGSTGGPVQETLAPALVFPAWAQPGPTPAAPAVLPGATMTYPGNYPAVMHNGSARASVDSKQPNEIHGHFTSTSRETSGNIPKADDDQSHYDVYPVPPHEIIQVGDILFFSGGPSTMISVHKSTVSKGLQPIVVSENAASLEGDLQFYELVLSESNPYTGHVLSSASFGQHYGCSVIALRRRGQKSECLEYLCVCMCMCVCVCACLW